MEKIKQIRTEGNVIERLPSSVVDQSSFPQLVIPRPVIDVTMPRFDYPTIQVPLPAPQVAAPSPTSSPSPPPPPPPQANRSLQEKSQSEQDPPYVPVLPQRIFKKPNPKLNIIKVETAQTEKTPQLKTTIEIAGLPINVPQPKEIAQASLTAIIGTSVTLATAMVFNQLRKAVGAVVTKATRNKFKIKLRSVKPVLHFIEDEGGVNILEYSEGGVKTLASNVKNPEQYLRDVIESDELYELDHKIVIDEPLRHFFSKEGAKRFSYFAPSKKMARRLAARFIFG